MNKVFDWNSFSAQGCKISEGKDYKSILMECSKEGGRLITSGMPPRLGGIDWADAKYIVVDVESKVDFTIRITFEFWERSNLSETSSMKIIQGILPHFKTRLVVPLTALDSQNLFLPRTPGRLRTSCMGKRTELGEINRFAIGINPSAFPQKLEIFDFYLTHTEPNYPLPEVKLVDEMGQNMTRTWSGKIDNAESLNLYLQSEACKSKGSQLFEGRSSFGGWEEKRFDATGYFRTQQDDRRWWLVDPQGYAFFSSGITCMRPEQPAWVYGMERICSWLPDKEGEYSHAWNKSSPANLRKWKYKDIHKDEMCEFGFVAANLIRAFGDQWEKKWENIMKKNLLSWGMNTIANWASISFIKSAGLPYVWQPSYFPTTPKCIFRDFPDVFSNEYMAAAEVYAKEFEPLNEDPYMIGYFLRNEPEWAFIKDLNLAEELLNTTESYDSKEELIIFLSQRYGGSVENMNNAWGTSLDSFDALKMGLRKAAQLSKESASDLVEFSKLMIKKYVEVPSKAVKKVDPNHLNLGMRFAMLCENVLVGAENYDVFSFNCYKESPVEAIAYAGEKTGLPVMIGEFHFGALDRGLPGVGILGANSQEDRGKAYSYYMENAAATQYCVGAHYFQLYDQCIIGRPDGANHQIGFLDVCSRPYKEIVEFATETNRKLYYIADGRARKTVLNGDLIGRVGC